MFTSCTEYRALIERHLDGTLGDAEQAQLRAHAKACEGCRRELTWLDVASGDLERLGDSALKGAPVIDVRAAVLESVQSGEADEVLAPKPTVVRFSTRRPLWPRALAVAAALALAALGLFYVVNLANEEAPADVAVDPRVPSQSEPGSNEEGYDGAISEDERMEMAVVPPTPPEPVGQNFDTAPPPPRVAPPQRPTPMTAVDAFRLALVDDAAANRDRLSALATLDLETARALAQDPNASAETLLGAALNLPPEEATDALEAAVAKSPDSPALRFHLAQNYADTGQPAAANEQLAELQRLDPNNAMPDYLQAQSALRGSNPNVESALAALKAGNANNIIDPYTVANAVAQEAALVAAGTDPDTARLVTAFTMGENAYDDLTGVATSLLDAGTQLASEQNLTALLEAVLEFGTQVETNAEYIQERQAGLDIQQAALDQLAPIVANAGDAQSIHDVSAAASHLIDALGGLSNYMNSLQTALAGAQAEAPESEFWQGLADIIYQQGDLDLLDLFSSP